MTDTINAKDARYSLLTKEIYLQMKNDQKSFLPDQFDKIKEQYNITYNTWFDSQKEIRKTILGTNGKDYRAWVDKCPKKPWILLTRAREMNIVYGMIRGHAYKEIENKYRENNEPSLSEVHDILEHYGIDKENFYTICGEI